MSTRDEYIAKMKTQLDDWSVEISALEERAQDFKDDAKVKYEEQLAVLRAKREEGMIKLEAMMAEVKSASETAWEQVKTETEHAWEALKDSVATFRTHYK